MLLIIFGAGASFDCVPDALYSLPKETRLPLANDLFVPSARNTAALNAYPDAQPVAARIRSRGAAQLDVEKELGEIRDEAEMDPGRLRHLMGVRFYLQKIISEAVAHVCKQTASADNYAALIDHLRTWQSRIRDDVAAVSFNYDDLLERAISASFRVRFGDPEGYLSTPIPVFKPHGSINWRQRFELTRMTSGAGRTDALEHAELLEPTNRFESRTAPQFFQPGVAWAPGIAVPLAVKSSFACPDSHIIHLNGLLPEVDRLLLVGWRAREQHFYNLLDNCTSDRLRTLVVCESDAATTETIGNLPARIQRNARAAPTRFSGLVSSPHLSDFLGSDN